MPPGEITPKYDSTLGLIFRLNNLWSEVDVPAKTGDYELWNNLLDRLYNNLAYRGKTKVVRDDNNKIISMDIDDLDEEEYKFLSRKVNFCKQNCHKARGSVRIVINGNYKTVSRKAITLSRWYKALNTKDVWLRRFMHKLNLYIKETRKTPGSAMWGGKN